MKRRDALTAVATGATFFLSAPVAGFAAVTARTPPAAGDRLVHGFGDLAGTLIVPDAVGDGPLFAFPMTPGGLVKNGSLHNQVTVLRLDATRMAQGTRRYAAGPLVALSSACTHTGCEVSGWDASVDELVCPCHGSRYDVLDGARVVAGPAPKPLAFLPIALDAGSLRVTGPFSRRVGPAPAF